MLRKIRIGISALFFVLITFFFLDFAEILPNSFHRLAHLQFVPALLSLSVGILLFLIVLTLLFGRRKKDIVTVLQKIDYVGVCLGGLSSLFYADSRLS